MKAAQVRTAALALPDTAEKPHFDRAGFYVRGKIFATLDPTGTTLNVFVAEEDREAALALHPECLEKLIWGKRCAGVTVILESAKAPLVKALLQKAWTHKAPKVARK